MSFFRHGYKKTWSQSELCDHVEHRNTIDANFLLRIISICNLGLMLKVVFTWF